MAAALEAVLGGTDDVGACGGVWGVRQKALRGSSGQERDQRPEPGPSTQPPVAPAPTSHARANAHFPLFTLLQDSHSV